MGKKIPPKHTYANLTSKNGLNFAAYIARSQRCLIKIPASGRMIVNATAEHFGMHQNAFADRVEERICKLAERLKHCIIFCKHAWLAAVAASRVAVVCSLQYCHEYVR
jgi:hypothetical protein